MTSDHPASDTTMVALSVVTAAETLDLGRMTADDISCMAVQLETSEFISVVKIKTTA